MPHCYGEWGCTLRWWVLPCHQAQRGRSMGTGVRHNANQHSRSAATLNYVLRGEVMFACIYVPDFPVEAIVRAEPSLRERAVAVLEGKPPQVRVIALNEKARRLGMEVNMTKLQAAVFVAPE